jgi:hypothetical protein
MAPRPGASSGTARATASVIGRRRIGADASGAVEFARQIEIAVQEPVDDQREVKLTEKAPLSLSQ